MIVLSITQIAQGVRHGGEKKPRFRVVGVSGGNVKIYVKHVRKKELEQIGRDCGAEVVYLDAGQGQQDGGGQNTKG